MRAVLAEIHGAYGSLYPRRDAVSRRSPREKLAADVAAALSRWPSEWRERGEPMLRIDEDPILDGRLIRAWSPRTIVSAARCLARLFDDARRHGFAPDLTPAIVRDYLARSQQRAGAGEIRVASVAATLRFAVSLAAVLFPERGWDWLRRAERGLKRLAEKAPSRNAARAHDAPELYLAGCALFDEAMARLAIAKGRRDRTKAFRLARVGLAIVLLITTPIRIDALARLRLGDQLDADFRRLKLTAGQTKERRADEREIPEPVRALLMRFMTVRAEIAARTEASVFVSERSGGPLTSDALSRDVVSALRHLLGYPVNPHAFRHSAATFTVSEAPAEADLAQTILNHRYADTTRRYRTAARQVVAGRALRRAHEGARANLE